MTVEQALTRAAGRAFTRSVDTTRTALIAGAPVDTGATKAATSVTVTRSGPNVWAARARADTPQASFTNSPRGTGGGPFIEGNPTLFFRVNGQLVAAKRVRVSTVHKGWFDRPIDAWPSVLGRSFS